MLHIIQNDPEVPPGNLLDSIPADYLLHHPYREEPLPAVSGISALIVLGGAMNANDEAVHPFLCGLKVLIRQVVQAGIPYLGICLGGQLLAGAMGARVVQNRWEELGTLPVRLSKSGITDPLFAGIPEEFATFQWHHDSFDLPLEAILLASSPACPHQAFRLGERAWGLQFHPEVTERIIRDWCAWDPGMSEKTEETVARFAEVTAGYRTVSGKLMGNFLKVVEPAPLS